MVRPESTYATIIRFVKIKQELDHSRSAVQLWSQYGGVKGIREVVRPAYSALEGSLRYGGKSERLTRWLCPDLKK